MEHVHKFAEAKKPMPLEIDGVLCDTPPHANGTITQPARIWRRILVNPSEIVQRYMNHKLRFAAQ